MNTMKTVKDYRGNASPELIQSDKNQILIDWFSFSVLSETEPTIVIQDYLKLDPAIFSEQGYGVNGYRNCLFYDQIKVYYNGRETKDASRGGNEFMGVFVSMSGTGCRQYEKLGGKLLDLMKLVHEAETANLTRIDFALDDVEGKLDMDDVVAAFYNKTIRSKCRNRRLQHGETGEYAPARTVYIGSTKSDLFFRIYDKSKEQYNPSENIDGYNSHWIRVEMVLRHEVAERAVYHILSGMKKDKAVGLCVSEMVLGHLQFIERTDSNISRCPIAKWWLDFLNTFNGVEITGKEEVPHVIEKSLRWFNRSIAPLASVLFRAFGVKGMLMMLSVAAQKTNSTQEKMLEVFEESEAIPPTIFQVLGHKFAVQCEKLMYHPESHSRWQERETQRNTERAYLESLMHLPKIKDLPGWMIEQEDIERAVEISGFEPDHGTQLKMA